MKKYVLGLMVFLLALFCFSQAIAGTDLWDVGSWKIDSTGALIPASTASQKVLYEAVATGETLVVADSGKVIVYAPVSATQAATFVLPTATVGQQYTVTATTAAAISVDPASGDTIKYLTLDSGDKITSASGTSDSVTLVSYLANYWAVRNMNGTWTDGG